jgi:hypothetical protein
MVSFNHQYTIRSTSILLIFFLVESNFLSAQKMEQILKCELTRTMYIVDTIKFDAPLVIEVADSMGKLRFVIMEKKDFINKETISNPIVKQKILERGNFFCPTYQFICLLNNNDINTEINHQIINDLLKKSKREIWSEYLDREINENYFCYTLDIKSFLIILVRNDFLNPCQSRDEIKIINNNEYHKIIVPLTW